MAGEKHFAVARFFVFGVIFAPTSFASMFSDRGSQSAKTGVAPSWSTHAALHGLAKAGVMTSSPEPMPRDSTVMNIAVYAELVAIPKLLPTC